MTQGEQPTAELADHPTMDEPNDKNMAIIRIATVYGLLAVMLFGISPWGCMIKPTHVPHSSAPTRIFGMWVWQPKYVQDTYEQDELIEFCRQLGINRLLVQVHFDRESLKQGDPKIQKPEALQRFLRKANHAGILVEALDGHQNMGLSQQRANALAKLDAILAFNNSLPISQRFEGIHYDIEPYTLPQWNSTQRSTIMHEYLEFHEAAAAKAHRQSPPLVIGASVPFWYDLKKDSQDQCVLEYRGQVKNFHEHIQDITDYVAIMSYRRWAKGEDSISSHIISEVEYALEIGKLACAGIETIRLDETPEISFFGLPPRQFWRQKKKLESMFAGHGGFGGVVVHDYEGFRQLVDPQLAAQLN